MTKIKEGRYTYYIIPEQRLVKCVSTYAKKPVTGWAKCADTDEFDENTGKEIARIRCDDKVNKKRIAFLKALEDTYFNELHYYMVKHGRICTKLRAAEKERRDLIFELKKIREM